MRREKVALLLVREALLRLDPVVDGVDCFQGAKPLLGEAVRILGGGKPPKQADLEKMLECPDERLSY